jgi:predicted transcriptional regulator
MLSNKQKTLAAINADKRLIANAKLAAIALLMHGGRLTRPEIAERINSHDRTMSRIMGRLVDLGLVDETRDGMTSAKSYRWIGEDK